MDLRKSAGVLAAPVSGAASSDIVSVACRCADARLGVGETGRAEVDGVFSASVSTDLR